MKTNEAPEKIYITPHFERRWFTKEIDDASVEYTRTDALVEKAYNWLKYYTFVDDNNNVNLPTLLHDFLKDSRTF